MGVLIITCKEDPHPTKVIQSLKDRNVSVFRLNTDTFLSDYDLSWDSDFLDEGFTLRNIHTGLTLKESEITSVWFRRNFKPVKVRYPGREEVNNHNLTEAQGFLEYLYNELYDKFSIGNYVFDDIANSKIYQIKTAKKVGFDVPETCYSNRKEDIIRFTEKHEWLVLKSIKSNAVISDNGNQHVFFAQKVKSEDLIQLPQESFEQTINFVQPYIEKAYELRVTVVCNDIFACRIDSQNMDNDHGKIDWRQGLEHGMKHSAYELPDNIKEACREYLRMMHLNFGCFDFIVTPHGEYVFLECNPNGQWLWIEKFTGMPISESIARHLAK